MPTLYNCRTADNGWLLTKFDDDFNVAGFYTVKTDTGKMICDCPGWPRKQVCKHTRMVNIFALRGAIDTHEFYCYEMQQWHTPLAHLGLENDATAERATEIAFHKDLPETADVAKEFAELLHPEPAQPKPTTTSIRRL